MAYSQSLKDPRWQKRRLEVMNRDNFTCQYCKSTEKTLNVHHFSYKGDPWEVDIECLITLCVDCHESETRLGRMNPTLQKASEMSNVLINEIIDFLAEVLSSKNRYEIIEYIKTIKEHAKTIH